MIVQRIWPYLLYEDGAAAIDFLTCAFGFRELSRTTGAAGGLHAELEVLPGASIYLGQPRAGYSNPAAVGATSQVYVVLDDDVDAHCERARAAGAHVTEEPNDLPFGHRRYGCVDPQGHEWYFARPIAD
jgi:uncharacterized glyoxalase superfamily protein PhnB